MKKLFFLSVFISMIYSGFSQDFPITTRQLSNGWTKVLINQLGYIELPPTLEIQDRSIKPSQFIDYRKVLVAQQKGLNERQPEAFNTYARVIVMTVKGNSGDFERLNFDINAYAEEDIKEIEKELISTTSRNLAYMNMQLIKWGKTELIKVNGMSCLHYSYIRQMANNPYVFVDTYTFFNYDRRHSLTLSYYLKDKSKYENDFEKIVQSFHITNIK